MADAETLNDIIELIVGMVDAAPGADILAELEVAVDAGATVEDIAVAIAANPAWSGDTGLFPDFLPNAIFADQWITQLLGDFVDETTLQEAIDEMTALLNSEVGRGEAMYATVVALSETTDPDLADASAALANKTAVASYYSIDVAQSSEDLDDLLGVVAGVDETAASVTTATGAIDDAIAAVAPLASLIANLDEANDAKTAFLAAQDIDNNPLTPTSEANIEAARDAAEVLVAADANVDAAYDGATDALKASLLATAEILFAADLAALQAPATVADTAVAAVTGLDSAIANFEAAVTASDAAIASSLEADAAADGALANYNTLNASGIGLNADGTTDDATTIILSGTTLVLGAGITETTDPGVTALLAAAQAREAADAAELVAIGAANTALEVVENLDLNATRTTDLTALAGAMNFVTPDTTGKPTDAEIASEASILQAGEDQLIADIGAILFTTDEATTEGLIETILDAATAANYITQAQNDAIEALFDAVVITDQASTDTAIAAAVAGVPTNSLSNDFTALQTAYDAEGTTYTGGLTVAAGLALAPLALAQNVAQAAVDAEVLVQAAWSDELATEQAMDALQDSIADLDADIAAAEAAFGDAGFEVPTALDSALKAAGTDDDVFLLDGIDSTILSFGVSGDDLLFVGSDVVLNPGDVDDDGDDTVLEVFLDGADVIIETSVFGSNAVVQEIITITLSGIDTADLVFDGGFLSLG